MPFTISHAAVVLPFSRPLARWRVLSAAVIGSMAPDFHVFSPWHLQRVETHSAMSLFTFSLPLGLCMYWVFQYLIKVPLLEILPDAAYARWLSHRSPASIGSPTQWALAAGGVIAGAFTHLVWDAFTHEGARGVRLLQHESILNLGHHHWMVMLALQGLSSLIGLAIVGAILVYGLRPSRDARVDSRRLSGAERRGWRWLILLGSLALWTLYLASAYSMEVNRGAGLLIYDSAIALLRALATVAVLSAGAIKLRLRALTARPVQA